MSETKTKQPAPFLATLQPDGIVLEDEGDKRYNSLANHPKFGRDFKAGRPLKLPTTPGSKLRIVDQNGEDVLFEEVSSLQVEQVLGFIHVTGAEFEGTPLKLPELPKAWEKPSEPHAAASNGHTQRAAAPQEPLPASPPPPPRGTGPLSKPAASATERLNPMGKLEASSPAPKPAASTNGAAAPAGPIVDHMVELEIRALVADQAKKQIQNGNTKGWAVVLKNIVDKRIESTPAASKEPLAALMLKGLVEKGAQDAYVQEAICRFCMQVAKGDPALEHKISEGARKFAASLNNPYAIEMPEEQNSAAVTGMNLFAKALMKLESKAYGTRLNGIAYIAQQIPYEASKAPSDPRDQAAHVKRIQDAINKVESHQTFKTMVDKKAQAQYQANLNRAKDVLSRFSKDKD